MNTTEKITDKAALLERIITGKPLEPEVYRRIREKGIRITDELRQTYGEMDIAVELIREVRDESYSVHKYQRDTTRYKSRFARSTPAAFV